MPPKAKPSTSASPDVTFLYQCYEHSDHKKINFRAVADEHDTTVGAANKRFSRINSTHTATPAFMYSCLKHSGYQKINWNTLANNLNTTSGAVSKRFSRLKAKLEVSDQATTAGEEEPGTSPALSPQKATKRKRNASSPDEESDAYSAGERSEEQKKPAPKAKKTRKTRPAWTVNVSQDKDDMPLASDSAGRQLQHEMQSTVEFGPSQRSETLTNTAESQGFSHHTVASIDPEFSASTFDLPSDVAHILREPVGPIQPGLAIPVADRDGSFESKMPATPLSRRSEYRNLLDLFEATSRPGSMTPSPRRSHSPYSLSSPHLDSQTSRIDHTPAYKTTTGESFPRLDAEETIWQAMPYPLNPVSSMSSYSQNFFDHRAAYQDLAGGKYMYDEENMYGE